MKTLSVIMFVLVTTSSAFAQQLPTTGESLGRGKIIAGQSFEGRYDVGKTIDFFGGIGVTKNADAFMMLGHDEKGWIGLGFNATAAVQGPFNFSISMLVRGTDDFVIITPRLMLSQKITERVTAFG